MSTTEQNTSRLEEPTDLVDESPAQTLEQVPGDTHFMQNRELSWLTFDERVLDQGAAEDVPLLARLNFISIFRSNLQEFFMVRVGSLTDLSYVEPPVRDSKTNMTPQEQLLAIYKRCRELYPKEESVYEDVRARLANAGVAHLRPADLNDEQREYLAGYMHDNIELFLSPQIINARHPFPHLENGKIYIVVRLDERLSSANEEDKAAKKKKKKAKEKGADGVVLGLIPLPHQCERVIQLPGKGFQFILLEHVIEMFAQEVFSMYKIKHVNVICVTRNADLDTTRMNDSADEDYRESMKHLLRQRTRLAPVRLECEAPLSPVMEKNLLARLNLEPYQVFETSVPLDLGFTWGLADNLPEKKRLALADPAFTPQWPSCLDRNRPIIDQVSEHETLLMYPYESMDPFVQLLREAANDPSVISIKITLYRLARQSHLAEALIAAAENGKEVTALFELRARFDEANNIEWSQRFEQAGCNVIYGFEYYKVHSKICCITRQTPDGLQYITQLGTGNYNEKTAKQYTDLSFITTDKGFGRDAVEFFRNMSLENISDNYDVLQVAPLQIEQRIIELIDDEIAKARAGKPCGIFMKTNSVTDARIIRKIVEASQAGVGITMLVRGICCLVPQVPGYTENVHVYSIVGKLLEHSRIYCFGAGRDCKMYLSSADLMTRNMSKRVEIAWPIFNDEIRGRILDYVSTCLKDTAKLRELRADGTYTPLGACVGLCDEAEGEHFDSQVFEIKEAYRRQREATAHAGERTANSAHGKHPEVAASAKEADATEEDAAEKADAAAEETAGVKTAAETSTPTASNNDAAGDSASEPSSAPAPAAAAPMASDAPAAQKADAAAEEQPQAEPATENPALEAMTESEAAAVKTAYTQPEPANAAEQPEPEPAHENSAEAIKEESERMQKLLNEQAAAIAAFAAGSAEAVAEQTGAPLKAVPTAGESETAGSAAANAATKPANSTDNPSVLDAMDEWRTRAKQADAGKTVFAPESSVPKQSQTPSFIDQKPQVVPIPKKRGLFARLFGRK